MKYKVYYQDNNKLKTITLLSDNISNLSGHKNYPSNIIKIKEIKSYAYVFTSQTIKEEDIIEFIYEISTILNAKLSMKEAIQILKNTNFNDKLKSILSDMEIALLNGQNIYTCLKKHENILGDTCILFFKLGEENSNMASSISSLHTILKENHKIKKRILKSLNYPIILSIALCISLISIFYFVLPKFDYIFSQLGDNLPLSTKILLDFKYILVHHSFSIIWIFFAILTIFILMIKKYRYIFDKIIFLYIPVFSKMHKYFILYKLFLSLHLIVKSKFQFQNALTNAKNISKNKYVRQKIKIIIAEINQGISISNAFAKSGIFSSLTIRLLQTAQKTNKVDVILEDLTKVYKKELERNINNFTTFFEPLLVFVIAIVVLWLVLAIMTPIWNLSSIIN